MRRPLFILLAGCTTRGETTRLVASTAFTITDSSGIGPSHLDVLKDQTVAIGIELRSPAESLEMVGGCPTNQQTQEDAPTRASGDSAPIVKTELLDYLPDWRLRLSLCASQASLQLASDNFMNTGFTIGCTGVPASAMQHDGDGNPVWSSFTTSPTCTLQILDADTNRVLEAHDFVVTVEN